MKTGQLRLVSMILSGFLFQDLDDACAGRQEPCFPVHFVTKSTGIIFISVERKKTGHLSGDLPLYRTPLSSFVSLALLMAMGGSSRPVFDQENFYG
jgi:hypothetical protein